MSKVKRVVLGEGMLCANMCDDMVGLREADRVSVLQRLDIGYGIGKIGRLVFEITEPKRKRRGTA